MRPTKGVDVVFVGHEASRTGAPRVLLELVRWLAISTPLRFEIVLKRGGPLASEFADVAPTFVCYPDDYNPFPLSYRLLLRFAGSRRAAEYRDRSVLAAVEKHVFDRDPRLIYLNSVAGADLLRPSPRQTLITHVHEMLYTLRQSMTYGADALNASTRVIVPSQPTLHDLVALGFRDLKVDVIPEFVNIGDIRSMGEPNPSKRGLTVIACGGRNWRKGADVFLQLAAAVRNRMRTTAVEFVWLGGSPTADPSFTWQLEAERLRLGDGAEVTMIDEVADPRPYLAAADVFALPSREDPFPLVAIEAAALGKPIVCFDSTGAREIAQNAGVVVQHLDVAAMADAVVDLLSDPTRRERAGAEAMRRAEGYDVSVVAPRILEILDRVL